MYVCQNGRLALAVSKLSSDLNSSRSRIYQREPLLIKLQTAILDLANMVAPMSALFGAIKNEFIMFWSSTIGLANFMLVDKSAECFPLGPGLFYLPHIKGVTSENMQILHSFSVKELAYKSLNLIKSSRYIPNIII